jgi:hypothetical protein
MKITFQPLVTNHSKNSLVSLKLVSEGMKIVLLFSNSIHCQRLRNRSAQQQHGNDHSTPPLVVETIGYLSSIGGSSLRTDCAVGIVFVAVTRRGDSLRVIDERWPMERILYNQVPPRATVLWSTCHW